MISELASRLAAGPTLEELPGIVDVSRTVPPNPPEQLQVNFVGLSFEAAYGEADRFVAAVSEELTTLGRPGLRDSTVLDFGSGWGRISRVLLTEVAPSRLYAADVDPEMTALVNTTLPGINALTVTPHPPTVLGDASMDVAVAFSVFSHLSGDAHKAWAHEFGRVVKPGGVIAVTILGEEFIDVVANAKAAVASGEADDFSKTMAPVFDDITATRAGFHADEIQFGATGGGGVRTSDYYGWAAASRHSVEKNWGAAGFELVRWRPSGELFPQALAVMVRKGDPTPQSVARRVRAVGGKGRRFVGRQFSRIGSRLSV
jgi:ubiquinone/menaquinone biosynthesis C-methylase UbiE